MVREPLHIEGRVALEPLGEDLQPLGDGRHALVLETFIYVSPRLGRITIPEGRITDYNSTPRIAWRAFPPWMYPFAGIVHDGLYLKGGSDDRPVTRQEADDEHQVLMLACEAPRWKAAGAHFFLRVGGWKAWANYRAKDADRQALEAAARWIL